MRIGILGSSGGSVARELVLATGSLHNFSIVTDRLCGLEAVAREFSLPRLRIDEADNTRFSLSAKHFFDQQGGVDLVLLFYLRLVTPELFDAYPTFNVHPSLLPDYRGFKAIERAHFDRIEELGATLHLVDEKADHGPQIAQVSTTLQAGVSIEPMRRISFAQKCYLSLYLLDRFELERGTDWLSALSQSAVRVNPMISNDQLRDYYRNFLVREGLEEIA